MDVLYLLLPISGIFTLVIVIALFWAVKSGQFDDLEGPAYRILMDDDEAQKPNPSDKAVNSDDKKD